MPKIVGELLRYGHAKRGLTMTNESKIGKTAARLSGLVLSDIRQMTKECEKVGGINLGQGLCDLPTPPLVSQGAISAIEARKATYSFAEGTETLRQAIAQKMERDNGMSVDPTSEVVISVGASGAYNATLNALLDPGDGILLMEPYYGYHLNAAIVAGLEPQYLTLEPPKFSLDEATLRAAIKPNTRAVVVCTPSNPCGKMFDEAELKMLARIAKEFDLLVITDEIYEYIRYEDRPHISPATIDDLRQRTVTISGASKTFSITGWRIGWAIAPPKLAKALTLVNDLFYICAPTPLQLGVAAGFSAGREFFDELAADYQEKRKRICDALDAGGLKPIVPQGAYYVLADISHLGYGNAKEGAMDLLQRARVASIPGSAFYRGEVGEGLLRFCYAKEMDELDAACQRLSSFER